MSVPQTLSFMHLTAGELDRVVQIGHSFLKQPVCRKREVSLAWTHYTLGAAYFEWDQLDAAAQHFTAVANLHYGAHARAYHDSMLGLALTYQAQGRVDEAKRTVEKHLETTLDRPERFFLTEAASFQARLALLRGELEPAVRWLQTADLEFSREPMPWIETPRLTQARVLLAQGRRSDLEQAMHIVQELNQLAEEMHNIRRTVEILGLLALTHEAQGESSAALKALERAVAMAEPGGFVRTFVDNGPPMARLLYKLAERGIAFEYVGRLLADFPDSRDASGPPYGNRQAAQAGLVEPLTERELEVLELLNQRLSDREIAQTLVVSYSTVKKHTSNIYQKLGVNSRRQAVTKAKTLGILSPYSP
jgi:LuxR family maltose regulon positive regulatory protein